MATFNPCEQNYEKVNSVNLETLPNEVILKIFAHLNVKDLGRCAQVSKNFCLLAYDKTVWTKVLVTSGVVPHQLLKQALSRGTKYLGLSNLSFVSTVVEPNFPPNNQVEYLDLSTSLMDEKYFRQLILSCHNLKKLSVNDGYWKSEDLMKGILQNSNSLKVLDLSGCDKLKQEDVKSIVSSCLELTDANFDHMTICNTYSLSSIFANLTKNIEKLSLSGAVIGINDITEIMTRCKKITHLDLTWAHLYTDLHTSWIRTIKFPKKTQLKSLYLRGFNIGFKFLEMLILSCENTLQLLDISYCNMTSEAIQLIVSKCLTLTAVDFCGEKDIAFFCKNITPNIEKISLSRTDISNDDIKTLVRRCKKIKELDIYHTSVDIDLVVDEIILHLSSTLETLCLPNTNPARFSKFDNCSLFKFGSMPRLRRIWSQVMYEMEKILDLWEKQFPNVVLSSNAFCPIVTHPNIA